MHTAEDQSADAGSVGNEDALRGVFNAPKPYHTIRTYKVPLSPRRDSRSLHTSVYRATTNRTQTRAAIKPQNVPVLLHHNSRLSQHQSHRNIG